MPPIQKFLKFALFLGFICIPPGLPAQSNATIRVMAANLNGNTQSYQPFALRIFQGLKPDVVAIQEFNYSNNTAADFRSMLDTAFGTNFVYYREPFTGSGDIPNGIISRYPLLNSGSWADTQVSNRGFAWAQIDLPGTNDLYVVSVHFLTSSATARATEANNLKALMQANFPANAWIVLAGDFNADSRTETCVTTYAGYLSDFPVPVDNNGNSNTSANRNAPHDYVLPSLTLTNFETATTLPTDSFPSGLVFDSRVYTPLSDVAPVQFGDSSNAQHMAVMKDFQILVSTNASAPVIAAQPQSQIVSPGSNATFAVTATGTMPLSFQWLFNGTNISGATTNPLILQNVQFTNAGNYSVLITNSAGSATSSNAVLIVSNFPPGITAQPQSQIVSIGSSPTFVVIASGTAPLNFQWRFAGTNIPAANASSYTRNNVQTNDSGDYSVIVTNVAGSVTSSVATLNVLLTNPVVIAQWNFNSTTPDGNTSTGNTSPSIGTGTAALVGTTATFATGDATLDPAGANDNSGWNTTSYPTQGTGNKTRGAQFSVSTVGKQNIVVTWSSQSSGTGSKYGRLQFSTNGIDFVDFTSAFINGTSFTAKTNSLAAIANVNNNENFAIRLVSEFESTAAATANANYDAADSAKTYGTGGTMRYDMVTISGIAILPSSASAPTLNAPILSGAQFQFTVTGSAGSNYVVQTSTDLRSSNWISAFTNSAPFTFIETNPGAASQKFYRAVSPP